jgi:hypothetical protein
MDHAEVQTRLEAAVTGPGKLAALEADRSAEGVALISHLEDCDPCRRELEAWRLVDASLAVGTPDTVVSPPEARSRILAAVVSQGVARGAGASVPPPIPIAPDAPVDVRADLTASGTTRRPSSVLRRTTTSETPTSRGTGFRWLALAAAAAVAIFVLGAILGGPLGLTPQPEDVPSRADRVVNAALEVLSLRGHSTAALTTSTGQPGGFVAMSPGSGDLVVVSQALEPPLGAAEYECFLERDEDRSYIGDMHQVSEELWFWAGPVSEPSDAGLPGDEFLVILQGSTEPTLSGEFGV